MNMPLSINNSDSAPEKPLALSRGDRRVILIALGVILAGFSVLAHFQGVSGAHIGIVDGGAVTLIALACLALRLAKKPAPALPEPKRDEVEPNETEALIHIRDFVYQDKETKQVVFKTEAKPKSHKDSQDISDTESKPKPQAAQVRDPSQIYAVDIALSLGKPTPYFAIYNSDVGKWIYYENRGEPIDCRTLPAFKEGRTLETLNGWTFPPGFLDN